MPLGAFQDLAVSMQGAREHGGEGEPPMEEVMGHPLCPPADRRDSSLPRAG